MNPVPRAILTSGPVFLAALAAVLPAAANEPEPPPVLTLARAVEIALDHNHTLGVADAELSAADAQVEEAQSAFKPSIDIAEVFSWTTNPTMVFANKLGQAAFTMEDFAISSLNEPDPFTNFQTRLDIYQPVWVGGRNAASRDAAIHAREAAAAGRRRARQEVIHQVVIAYTGAVVAEAQREVARQTLESARANVSLVRDLREGGLVVESDLLQARVRESEVLELVARTEQGVAVSRAALNLALGREPTTPVQVAADLEADRGVDLADGELDALVAEARRSRPDLEAVAFKVSAAERYAEAARSGRRPEFGFRGSLEANDESYPGASGTNWTVMATLRFRLFDGGAAKAQVLGATEQVEKARRQEAQLHDAASLQVVEAFHDLRSARIRLDEAGRSVHLGEEGLRIVSDRYREGLTTLVELLDAEASLTRARAREVAARRDLMVSRAALDLAVGRL